MTSCGGHPGSVHLGPPSCPPSCSSHCLVVMTPHLRRSTLRQGDLPCLTAGGDAVHHGGEGMAARVACGCGRWNLWSCLFTSWLPTRKHRERLRLEVGKAVTHKAHLTAFLFLQKSPTSHSLHRLPEQSCHLETKCQSTRTSGEHCLSEPNSP